jgi:general secretion pathway protein D
MKKYLIQFPVCFLLCSTGVFSQVQVVPDATPNLPPPPPGIVPNLPAELPPSINSSPNAAEEQAAQDSVEQIESPAFSPLSDPEELLLIDGLDEEFQVLKIRDQDTNMILDMIQLITNRYILRPQNLPAVKITFDSMAVLTKRETLLAVESLLAMNGVAITKIDDKFYKAVPAQGANVHVPIWIEGEVSQMKPSQRIYVKMFFLEYVPVEKMRETLNSFATPNVSSLLPFPNANAIMVTDSLLNLQRMEKIIKQMDISKKESSTAIFSYKAKYTNAESLVKDFQGRYEEYFKNDFQLEPSMSYRTIGSEISVVCHAFDEVRVKEILEKLDTSSGLDFASKLVPLYHASSEDVAKMLNEFTNSQKVDAGSLPGNIQNPQGKQTSPSPKAVSTKGSDLSSNFSRFANVAPDSRSNGIFISGLKSDVEQFEGMIEVLDVPLPMARIDTIFVMVDLSQANQRGIDALFQDLEWSDDSTIESTTTTNPGADGQLGTSDDFEQTETTNFGSEVLSGALKVPLLNSTVPFKMQNWKLSQFQWSQIFSLASQRNDIRIFSTPSITVIHGGKGGGEDGAKGTSKIQIRDRRSVGLPTANNYGNQNTVNSGGIQNLDAITELSINNPRIRKTVRDENGNLVERGTVFMSVNVTAEKFDDTFTNTYEGQQIPSIKTRTAQTDIAIRDGQIMVIGGLQEVQLDTTTSKYNLLSDIPIIGEKLFTPKQTKYTPTELMIFMRPTIIDPENPVDDLTSKNIGRIDQFMKPNYTPVFQSPSGKSLQTSGGAQPGVQDKKSVMPKL